MLVQRRQPAGAKAKPVRHEPRLAVEEAVGEAGEEVNECEGRRQAPRHAERGERLVVVRADRVCGERRHRERRAHDAPTT